MKTKGRMLAAAACIALSACAASGTRVTAEGDTYRQMASNQRWWCNSMSGTCACTIDGQPATCSLVQACLNSGNCKRAM
jgi:hypothetical protein